MGSFGRLSILGPTMAASNAAPKSLSRDRMRVARPTCARSGNLAFVMKKSGLEKVNR